MDKAMLRCVEGSAKLGADWMAYHPRTAVNDNYSPRKSMEYEKQALAPLVEAAGKFGTGIAIENLPIFPCWDFGHAHLMNWEDEAKVIKAVGNRIKCTHIHSNYQKDDDHLPPLLGNTDWKPIMTELKKAYNGALMLEIDYKYNSALESYFKYSLDNLKYLEKL